MSIHRTAAIDARVSPHGWRRLPSGVWVTAIPLVDAANRGRFAHLDYATAVAVCARIEGARMIAPERVVELNRHGFRLRPEISAPTSDMSSRARCDAHDDRVMLQLAQGWDGELPVSGAGKPWVSGAVAPKARLFGWGKRVGSASLRHDAHVDWWQPLQNAHAWNHVDYSSLQTLEADADLGVEPWWDDEGAGIQKASNDTKQQQTGFETPGIKNLSAALLAAALASLVAGVRETSRNAGPVVDRWLRDVGAPTPNNWCAAGVTAWLREAEAATGTLAPIAGSAGAKAIMAQLQQRGRWHPMPAARTVARPGAIVVWHRGAPGAWTGHVGVVESADAEGMWTVEANSGPGGDRVARMRRLWSDPLLLGVGLVD